MLYKIGDFSKKVNVSVKTLRYYDEINLLKPAEIDLFTGYRYYSENQINDLKLILILKEVGFSLNEIKSNWDNFNNEIMLQKKQDLLNESNLIREKIIKIDYLRNNIINNKIILDNKNKEQIRIKKIGD